MQIQITYTHPPGPEAADAAGQLATLDDIAAELPALEQAYNAAEAAGNEDERAAYKSEIAAARDVLARRVDLAEAAARRAQTRITLHACSYLDKSHYWRLVREGEEWYEQQTGQPLRTANDPDDVAISNLVYYRAEILASIDRTRTGAGHLYACQTRPSQADAWQAGHLPAEWVTLDGMGRDMPADLLAALVAATRDLNAGILPSIGDFLAEPRVAVSRTA